MSCSVCSKGSRATLFCRRGDCPGLYGVSAVDLPRPDVTVIHNDEGKSHVVISRDGRGKSYEIVGVSPDEKIKGVVEKIIGDKYTGEWIP